MVSPEWEKRVVAVTGAGSGIGAATARRFHEAGAQVVLVDRCEKALELVDDLGVRSQAIIGDVSSAGTWAEVMNACVLLGRLDVLVSNAALQIKASITELAPSDWDAQIATNLTGVYHGLRTLAPMLVESTGRVVLVSSVHARVGLPEFPAYAATKGGLVALTRQVAVDIAPVRVNCVLPGPIMTPVWDHVSEPERARSAESTILKRFGQPYEVAAAIEFLTSDAASFITGTSLVVDGGWTSTRDSV